MSIGLVLGAIAVSHSTRAQSAPIVQVQQTERKAEGDRLFDQGSQQYDKHKYELAIQSWKQALELYRAISDNKGEAETLNSLGLINVTLAKRNLSNFQIAIGYYQQALPLFQAIRDQQGEANALGNIANAYRYARQYERAIDYYQQSLPVYRSANRLIGVANVLRDIGYSYRGLQQQERAIQYFQKALAVYQTLNNRAAVADMLREISYGYGDLAQQDKAIEYLQQALSIYQALGDRESTARVTMKIGIQQELLSHHSQALERYSQALQTFREIHSLQGEADTLGNQALVYVSLLQYDKSIPLLTRIIPLYQQLRDAGGEATAYMNLANVYTRIGEYDQAIENHQKALVMFRDQHNRDGEAMSLNNLGVIYVNKGLYDEAIKSHEQALIIYREQHDRLGEAKALTNMSAAYYFGRSQYEKALAYRQQSISIYREVHDRAGEAKALANLGVILLKLGRSVEAEHFLHDAISLYEAIRLDRLPEESKISLFEGQRHAYRTLQQVLIARNRTEDALTVADWGRAKALNEHLQQQLNSNSVIRAQAPELAQLKQIAQDQNSTLVEYSLISKLEDPEGRYTELYTWVVQPSGSVTFRRTNLSSLLPRQCPLIGSYILNSRTALGIHDRGYRDIENRVPPNAATNPCLTDDPTTKLKTLHKILIDPIADLFPSDPNQHVIFIPQDALFLVPFPALLNAKNTPLIQAHTIRTAPSIQILDQTHRLKPNGTGALVVGNPTMPVASTYPGEPAKQLESLKFAEQEANTIAPLLNTKALIHNQATKANILAQIERSRFLHFATHGFLYDSNGLNSWIALAPDGKDNGQLSAADILKLKLNAELVVLSACNTGGGKITGDGVVGLSRSFIAAGVPSVLVSLWSVDDASTSELMKEFYKTLQTNPDKAQALRQAMLSTMKNHPDPKDWAAFTLIGEAR